MFKLAFHTYEALSLKAKITKNKKGGEEGDKSTFIDEDRDFDRMSNLSDESLMSMTTNDR